MARRRPKHSLDDDAIANISQRVASGSEAGLGDSRHSDSSERVPFLALTVKVDRVEAAVSLTSTRLVSFPVRGARLGHRV